MAEDNKTFKMLVEEQKKTTSAIRNLVTTNEETSALDTETREKSQANIERGKKSWETRQANLLIKSNENTEDTLQIQEANLITPAEKEEQAREATSSMTANFKKFLGAGSFLGKGFGKLGDKVSNLIPGGGLKAIGGTLATVAVLGALVKFLQSDLWKDLKEKWIPVLGDGLKQLWEFTKDFGALLVNFYDNFLFPIKDIFATFWVKGFENIKTLFEDLGNAFDAFGTDGFWAGITGVITAIGDYIGAQIDNVATALYNVIARVFGLGETDSVYGSIKTFFSDLYNSVTTWVSDTFKAVKDSIIGAFTWVSDGVTGGVNFLTDLVNSAYESIKKFFTDAFTWVSDGVSTSVTFISDLVKATYDAVVGFFTGAFTWVSDVVSGGVSWISNLVSNTYDAIIGFFTGAFTWVSDVVGDGVGWLTGLVSGVFEDIKDFFTGAFNFVVGTGGIFAFNLFDMIKGAVSDAIVAVKALFSPDGLTLENFTALFGSLFDIVTAPVRAAFETLKSMFSWDTSDKESLEGQTSDLSIADMLMDIVDDAFEWFKGIFSFDVSSMKNMIPELPDFGEIMSNIIRGVLRPIVNFKKFGVSVRSILNTVGGDIGKNLISFVDQTGDYDPVQKPPPSKSAESIQQSEIDQFLKTGNTVVQMNGGNTNNSSTQVVANRDTQVSREMQALLSAM